MYFTFYISQILKKKMDVQQYKGKIQKIKIEEEKISKVIDNPEK